MILFPSASVPLSLDQQTTLYRTFVLLLKYILQMPTINPVPFQSFRALLTHSSALKVPLPAEFRPDRNCQSLCTAQSASVCPGNPPSHPIGSEEGPADPSEFAHLNA